MFNITSNFTTLIHYTSLHKVCCSMGGVYVRMALGDGVFSKYNRLRWFHNVNWLTSFNIMYSQRKVHVLVRWFNKFISISRRHFHTKKARWNNRNYVILSLWLKGEKSVSGINCVECSVLFTSYTGVPSNELFSVRHFHFEAIKNWNAYKSYVLTCIKGK